MSIDFKELKIEIEHDDRITFGSHIGLRWKDILDTHPGYILWCAANTSNIFSIPLIDDAVYNEYNADKKLHRKVVKSTTFNNPDNPDLSVFYLDDIPF